MTDQLRIGARRLGHARDDGFTLIESLTAAAILLVIAVAIVTTLIATGGWYSSARTRTEATAVANEVMSLILSRNYSDIHYAESNETWPTGIPRQMPWQTAYGDFTVETSMTPTPQAAASSGSACTSFFTAS
jgi:prepilin-type N-terminal cleavage/methylation domain-containing protein